MAINVACPECKQKLRVPEDWLGQSVECPDCGKSFQAARDKDTEDALAAGAPGSGPPPLPAGDASAAEDEEFVAPLDDDRPQKPRKKKRAKRRASGFEGGYFGELQRKQQRMMTPHRGVLILIVGIISLICTPSLVLGLGCGAWAYQMGTNDLNEMVSDRMDKSGAMLTQTGRFMGIIGACLSVFGLVLSIAMCIVSVMTGGAIR
jgi:hypothetical protein